MTRSFSVLAGHSKLCPYGLGPPDLKIIQQAIYQGRPAASTAIREAADDGGYVGQPPPAVHGQARRLSYIFIAIFA